MPLPWLPSKLMDDVNDSDPRRVSVPSSLQGKRFDVALILPRAENHTRIVQLVQQAIEKQFNVTASGYAPVFRRQPIEPPPAANRSGIEVKVAGLDTQGVTLISPTRSDFDALAEKTAPGWGAIIIKAKPYVTLISNTTAHKIVAYRYSFNGVDSSGQSHPSSLVVRDGDTVFGIDNARGHDRILPGGMAVATSFRLGPYSPEGEEVVTENHLAENAEQWLFGMVSVTIGDSRAPDGPLVIKSLQIKLDAVIFDDGQLIGEDGPNPRALLSSQFAAYIKAKQDLFRTIVGQIDRGRSVADAFSEAERNRPPDLSIGESSLYPQLALEEAMDLRKQYGDAKVRNLFNDGLLRLQKEPFVISKAK